jgi:hypothetical protein
MDRQRIMARAAAWMQARGWKQKLAKRRGGIYRNRCCREPSLFDE